MFKRSTTSMKESLRRFVERQRSPRTAKTYGTVAKAFLMFVRNAEPKRRDVERFLARPLLSGARTSVATYNQNLAAVRAFAAFVVGEGLWSSDPTVGIQFEREPEKDPTFLLVSEIHDFFCAVPAVSEARWQVRNLAILALGFIGGLRVSEVVRLDVRQVDLRSMNLVAIHRKGGRVQTLALEPRVAQILRVWIQQRAAMAPATETALVISDRCTRLSVRSIQRLYARVRRHLGMLKHASPHSARHSFVTTALDLGADITVVSRFAGHASIVTTMKYRHLLDRAPRAALALLGGLIPDEVMPEEAEGSEIAAGQLQFEFQRVSEHLAAAVIPANDTLDAQENLDDVNAAESA